MDRRIESIRRDGKNMEINLLFKFGSTPYLHREYLLKKEHYNCELGVQTITFIISEKRGLGSV